MNKNIIQKIVLAGVITRNGKILILQRNKNEGIYPNMWELPSGKKESLESSEDSLRREVKEETGLNIEVIMPFSVFDYQIKKQDEIRDSIQINFLVKPADDSEVKLSPEHQASAWIKKNEIDKYNLTQKTKKVLEKAFELILLLKLNQ